MVYIIELLLLQAFMEIIGDIFEVGRTTSYMMKAFDTH